MVAQEDCQGAQPAEPGSGALEHITRMAYAEAPAVKIAAAGLRRARQTMGIITAGNVRYHWKPN